MRILKSLVAIVTSAGIVLVPSTLSSKEYLALLSQSPTIPYSQKNTCPPEKVNTVYHNLIGAAQKLEKTKKLEPSYNS